MAQLDVTSTQLIDKLYFHVRIGTSFFYNKKLKL